MCGRRFSLRLPVDENQGNPLDRRILVLDEKIGPGGVLGLRRPVLLRFPVHRLLRTLREAVGHGNL